MAQVGDWLRKEVFPVIADVIHDNDPEGLEEAYDYATKLIKEKMLESYRNGLAAKPTSKFKARA